MNSYKYQQVLLAGWLLALLECMLVSLLVCLFVCLLGYKLQSINLILNKQSNLNNIMNIRELKERNIPIIITTRTSMIASAEMSNLSSDFC